ncbi:putative lipid-binding transport protein (Tim44 family) [Rhodopseudomonas rhenobacensis]|uniref:Putative lipid-binding transport protein (Tim44 family) n=1 Tax=Rhodopseudomonas rhenobacensis TaxID=87461 RepID=A0A7W8DZ44_9BRAD|nr:Tim44 domain-containing protein [Rhodopseudomonas rhenobacensis]MBB5047510.1 putative lipid-binding transport protein (Tim44 family) [Rhodopseudomonas rhenobacensis]
MKFVQRTRGFVGAIAVVMSLALPAMLVVASSADARVGGGSSSGSRGSRTFSAPPSTSTAPSAAQPFNRTMTQPGSPGMAAPAAGAAAKGGFFNRPGMGMLGGLAAGFLGAGLLGMLFGGGLFSGLGGISSIIGLILQIGLIIIVVRLAMSWWQRRNAAAPASASASAYAAPGAGPDVGPGAQQNYRTGSGFGLGGSTAPLEIGPADYEAFEKLLGEVQTTWSNGDIGHLHTLATPEMVSYFSGDLEANKARGVENKVSDVKLLQGDLAEAWREGETDYASVAMRFSLVDKTLDRATGKIVEGSEQPTEATEVWTFARRRGSEWELSAIQQT